MLPGTATDLPYTIQGKGDNVYVMNMCLPNLSRGIDLKTVRSNNHLVEVIWGDFYHNGISVGGGSSNGIVRNCHFTINTLNHNEDTVFAGQLNYIYRNFTAFEIGKSSNEIVVNNFVYGPNTGFLLNDGASGFNIIGGGSDGTAYAAYRFRGNVNGNIINSMTAIYPAQNHFVLNVDMGTPYRNRRYFLSENSYSGYVNIVNAMMWGTSTEDTSSAIELHGNGDMHFYGGIILDAGSPIINDSQTNLSTFGLIMRTQGVTTVKLNPGAKGYHEAGNICYDGICTNRLVNAAGINISANNNGIK